MPKVTPGLIYLLLFWLFTQSAFADAYQPVLKSKKLSLKEAIFLSLRYNPDVQSAELQRVVDKFAVAIARRQFEFQYNLNATADTSTSTSSGVFGGLNRNFSLTPAITKQTVFGARFGLTMTNPTSWNSLGGQTFYSPSLILDMAYPILQGSGREIVEGPLHQALIADEQAKLNLKATIIAQVTTIINDYYALVQAENTLMIDIKGLEVAKLTVQQNKKRIEIGFLAPSENDQAEAQVASTAIAVASDENAVQQARLLLLRDIGLPSSTIIEVDKVINVKDAHYPKGEEARQVLYANNIPYLQSINGLQSSKISLLLAEDQQRWILNVGGSITQGGGFGLGPDGGINSLFNGRNSARSVGLNLSVPIDDLPAQAGVVGAKTGYTQSKLSMKLLKLTMEATLLGSLENLRILFMQIGLTEQSELFANKAYQNALKKVGFGQSSMFEVTTLQTNLITAQIQTVNAKIGYLLSVANFQQNLGITLDVWKIRLVY